MNNTTDTTSPKLESNNPDTSQTEKRDDEQHHRHRPTKTESNIPDTS